MNTLHHPHRLIRTLLLVLGCAALAALPLAQPADVAAQEPDPTFTVSVPMVMANLENVGTHLLGTQMYGSLADSAISHSLVRESRMSWIRWEIGWRSRQPQKPVPGEDPVYNWGSTDASAEAARHLGLNVIATIVSNPEWASMRSADGEHWYSNGPIKPEHYADFARFIADMASRYPWITHYELYNEPDNAGMAQAESPKAGPYWGLYGKEYADMLKVVYPALKEANPRAQLVFGGIAYDMFADDACVNTPETCSGFYKPFLDDVLANGGGDYFDVFNFHYYPEYADICEVEGHDIIGKVNVLRRKLAERGYGDKPIICTEVGASSEPKPYDPTPTPITQARYITMTATRSLAAGMDVMIWWTWKNLSTAPFEHYGLVTQELQPKLGLQAFRTATLKLGGATYVGSLGLESQGVEGYEFRTRAGKPLFVLWSLDGGTHTVTLPSNHGNVTGMCGESLGPVADGPDGLADGKISVSVDQDPVFVEGA